MTKEPNEEPIKTGERKELTEYKVPEEKEYDATEGIKYLSLSGGFLDFDLGRRLKFGEGSYTIKTDSRYGFWLGHQSYSLAPIRISSSGNLILKDYTTLPTTGTEGEIKRSGGTLYIYYSSAWKEIG